MRADLLGDARAAGDPADDTGSTVAVESAPVRRGGHGPLGSLADSQVDRAGGARGERDSDDLSALASDHQSAVAALQAKVPDVGAGCLRYPQPVEGKQGDQRVLGGRPEPGGDEEGADLIAVQSGGVRLVVQPRPADVRGG